MSDFPVKEEDRTNGLAVMVVGLAVSAVLWASVVALQAYFMESEGAIATQRAAQGQTDIVRTLKAQHRDDLNKTTYADPKKGTLKRLAIEHAKSAVVRNAKAGAPSLIPSLGPLNVASIPATVGKPSATPPAAPAAGAVPAAPVAAPAPAPAPAPVAAPAPAAAAPVAAPAPAPVAAPAPAPVAAPAPAPVAVPAAKPATP